MNEFVKWCKSAEGIDAIGRSYLNPDDPLTKDKDLPMRFKLFLMTRFTPERVKTLTLSTAFTYRSAFSNYYILKK